MDNTKNLTDIIYNKLSSLFPKSNKDDKNTIDLQKTFSSENINVTEIIKHILDLPLDFPNNILYSKAGHKFNELEFFESNLDSNVNSKNASLFDNFNKTYTQLGSTLLKSVLINPTTDVDGVIKKRQELIISFLQNSKLTDIRNIIQTTAAFEKDVLAMQLEETPEMLEVYKVIFFQFKPIQFLNYNELFIKVFYYFIIIFSPLYGLFGPLIFMLAPYVFLKYVLKIPMPFDIFWKILKSMLIGGTGFFSKLNTFFNSSIG